jgi:hypothetical protein
MERTFSLNNTLGGLRVDTPAITTRGSLRTSFSLTRAAQVRARIAKLSGAGVATLSQRSLQQGAQTVAWRVRLRPGRYQVRITAQNAVGTVTSSAPFSVRRGRG